MIEITDATRVDQGERGEAVQTLLGQFRTNRLKKDMLMKLYGTHAQLADAKLSPHTKVFFCVILGLPPELADSAQRNRMRDEMARITNRISPSFHGTSNRPIIKVETIESWNVAHPNVQIT